MGMEDFPQVSQEDLQALLGTLPECKHDLVTDDLLGALGGGAGDSGKMHEVQNDPLLSDAFSLDHIQDNNISSTQDHHHMDLSGSGAGAGEIRLPPPLKLTAPIRLSTELSSADVVRACHEAYKRGLEVLPEKCQPPTLPLPPAKLSPEKLLLTTPSVLVENKKDAMSQELMEFCYNSPLCVIRGLSSVLKLDLGLFSTKTLVEHAPEHGIEIRMQLMQTPEENFDTHGSKSWRCESHRSRMSVLSYAQYQAHSLQEALKVCPALFALNQI